MDYETAGQHCCRLAAARVDEYSTHQHSFTRLIHSLPELVSCLILHVSFRTRQSALAVSLRPVGHGRTSHCRTCRVIHERHLQRSASNRLAPKEMGSPRVRSRAFLSRPRAWGSLCEAPTARSKTRKSRLEEKEPHIPFSRNLPYTSCPDQKHISFRTHQYILSFTLSDKSRVTVSCKPSTGL